MKRVISGTIVLLLAVGTGVAGPGQKSNHGLAEDWPFPIAAAEGEEEAPVITLEPLPQDVLDGMIATFTATVSGTPTPVLHWQRSADRGVTWTTLADGGVFSGSGGEILQLGKVTAAMNNHRFRLTATNSLGGTVSSSAILNVENVGTGAGYTWLVQGGTGTERVGKIVTDLGGNLCAAGSFSAPLKFGVATLAPQGAEDIFVLKLNSSGAVAWVKSFGGPGQDEGLGVAVDSQGNILVAGSFSDTITIGTTRLVSRGPRNAIVFKLDSAGNPLWAVRAGGDSWAVAKGVAVDPAGNVLIAGEYQASQADFGATVFNNSRELTDLFAAKLTANGSFSWAVTAGGRDTLETLRAVQVDGAGNAYITGTFDQGIQPDEGANVAFGSTTLVSAGQDDVFLSKINSQGAFVWTRQIGGEFVERVNAVATDAGGTTLLALYSDGGRLTIDGRTTTQPVGGAFFDSLGMLVSLEEFKRELANVTDVARANADNWVFSATIPRTNPRDGEFSTELAGVRAAFPGPNQDSYTTGGLGVHQVTAVASVPGGMYLGGTLGERVSFGQKLGYGEGPCLFFVRLNYPPAGAGPTTLRFVSTSLVGSSLRMVLVNRVGPPLTNLELAQAEVHFSPDLVNWLPFTGKISLSNGQLVLEEVWDAGAASRYYRLMRREEVELAP